MNILLGVCGSISAYKTLDLTRNWVKNGHQVRVILTKGAEEFVVPRVYKYLGAEEVYHSNDDFNYPKNQHQAPVLHVDLANWTDRFVIAPLSANTASKLARAEASDLLTSVFLAIPQNKPILFFPAMNTQMLEHPFVQENLESLTKLKTLSQVLIHPTAEGELACGVSGKGRLPDIKTISEITECFSNLTNEKSILLTAGATISPLDSVRYLTNPSSGKTSYHLAKEALNLGHKVHVVAGINSTTEFDHLKHHPLFNIDRVVTTQDMHNRIVELIDNFDTYISPAAISDIKFHLADGKLKKDQLQEFIPIEKDLDILSKVIKNKKPHQKIVGFAAESDLTKASLKEKHARKPVNLLIGTLVNSGLNGTEQKGFNTNEADYMILQEGSEFSSHHLSKKELASMILTRLN